MSENLEELKKQRFEERKKKIEERKKQSLERSKEYYENIKNIIVKCEYCDKEFKKRSLFKHKKTFHLFEKYRNLHIINSTSIKIF